MATIEATEIGELVESAVTAISILGGAMAYFSGFSAAQAMTESSPPDTLAQRVNEGLGQGFLVGSPLAVVTLIIEACI